MEAYLVCDGKSDRCLLPGFGVLSRNLIDGKFISSYQYVFAIGSEREETYAHSVKSQRVDVPDSMAQELKAASNGMTPLDGASLDLVGRDVDRIGKMIFGW